MTGPPPYLKVWIRHCEVSIFSVFTVMPSKIEMHTIQYRESEIWEMKEGKCTKSLAKNWVCTIFHTQDIQKNVSFEFIKLIWRHHVGVPLRGTNMAARNQQKLLFLSFPTNT